MSQLTLIPGLALRNLLRNTRRTLITSVAVVAGCAVLVLGWGFVNGLDENAIRAAEDVVTGHVVLRPPGYPMDGLSFPLDEAAPLDAAVLADLDDLGATAWAPRVVFPARITAGADSVRIRGLAYDPAREDAVFPRATAWSLDGAWPADTGELALGTELAALLGAKRGDTVILEARTRPGALNALALVVSGLVHTRNPQMDGVAWLPLAAAEPLLLLDGARTHVALRYDRRPDSVVATLPQSGWSAVTSVTEVADILAVNDVRRRAISVMVFILMAIAATGIANTVIMATYERVREIGTLRALGLSENGVKLLFLTEGAAMGAGAAAAGTLLGALVVLHYQRVGIDLSSVAASAGELSFSTILYLQFTWGPVFAAMAFGVGISVLASLQPALHAARMNPADAVRAD